MNHRRTKEKLFQLAALLLTWFAAFILIVLLSQLILSGWSSLKPHFFSSFPSRSPNKAGIYSAIMGSLWVIILTALISIPIGLFSALYLEEYTERNKLAQLLQMNIATLAGMPSIVYGLLSLAIFVRYLKLDRSVLSGALCLSLLVLPTIIISAQGAIRAVPQAIRDAAYALGARKYQVVFGQVLPAATPGIMTGIILAVSRAIGESAPLILIGAFSYVAFVPKSVMDSFTVLPVQIYNWASRPQEEFHSLAAGAILVLIGFLLVLNFSAIVIRSRFQRYK